MSTIYEKLPLVDLTAPKAISRRSRTDGMLTNERIAQDTEDAGSILKLAGLDSNPSLENTLEAREKYMIEIRPINKESSSFESPTIGARQKGARKPHYTRLLAFDNKLIFQAACCLPLKIIAASLDGNRVSGRVLFNSHSEECGGKLVYGFLGKGAELVIDIKRGESARAQRLIFSPIPSSFTKVPLHRT